jgi:hypothetical protein
MAFNYEFPYTDPNLYNDDWLLKRMKELLGWMHETDEWKTEYAQAYEDFKKMVEDIESGTFPDSIVNAFTSWMQKNGLDLVGKLVKMVFFGITDDGYFVAYIPEFWDDIIFNTTGYDISIAGYDFGHLVLSFAIGG